MDIAPATTAAAANRSGASASAITTDYQTFLNMMTTQMRNQDPLDPLDADEFAMQLATFSGVEQQVRTNDLLAAMSTQLALSSMADMSGWVGKEVRVAAAVAYDGATPLTVAPNPVAIADRVDLVAYDADGVEVLRQRIPVSAEPVSWAGIDDNGQRLPAGQYTFKVESWSGGEMLLSEQAEVYGLVNEVRAEDGEILLVLKGGAAVLAENVTGVRSAT